MIGAQRSSQGDLKRDVTGSPRPPRVGPRLRSADHSDAISCTTLRVIVRRWTAVLPELPHATGEAGDGAPPENLRPPTNPTNAPAK